MAAVAQLTDVKARKAALYRDAILDAAERLFALHGPDNVKVQQIAETAGLSLATLYNTCTGKEQIEQGVHERRLAELFERATGVVDPGRSAFANILAGIESYGRYFAEHPEYLRMHLHAGNDWATALGIQPGATMEAWQRGMALLVEMVRQAMADGDLVATDPVTAARLMTSAQQVMLSRWLEDGAKGSVDALVADVRAFILRAFARNMRVDK